MEKGKMDKSIYGLKEGAKYVVIQEFKDYDDNLHVVGENWIFEKKNFVPYESGWTVHVLMDGESKVFRFQSYKEEQEELLKNLFDYIEEV